ncbi:MAG TPA: ATP-binding protein [Pseudomonadota bacterium]|nr:ATP-binding protein [Pseudomonadota bacterium]
MRTIRGKILLGFALVLLSFGGATLYGAWAVHTLGQQLRLVALGYSNLRLELQDQQTIQANLQKRLAAPAQGPHDAEAVTADRKLRRLRLLLAQQHLGELRRNLPPSDALFLSQVAARLQELAQLYAEIDALPPGSTGDEARRREEQAAQLLVQLSSRLTNKVIEVVFAGERYEARAVAMTAVLALSATACGILVLWLVQATLRPLRQLCDSAREVARGNYRERVAAGSPDEVGALGREFNAMAAALAEREQRLRRSEQLATVGKMAAQITHEVRNPLTSIGLNAELLAEEFTDKDREAQKLAKAIVREVDRLTDITEQYLRFARLPEPRFEPTSVTELLRSLLLFLDGELRARGVTVVAQLAEGLPQVPLDDNQVRQAALNLVRNAAEAMTDCPPGERVLTVRSRLQGAPAGGPPGSAVVPAVAIDIIDRGPGIAPAHLRQIFEPFFTTKKGGTGLGLALALEVVARHGGQLSVHSPEPAAPELPPGGTAGTRFTIVFPCGSAVGAPSGPPEPPVAARELDAGTPAPLA